MLVTELLRRMDLPLVDLAPLEAVARQRYFLALEAADRPDWKPLMRIWQERLEQTM